MQPKSSEPKQAEPQPSEPQQVIQSVVTQPVSPQVAPQPVAPQPVELQPIEPQPVEPLPQINITPPTEADPTLEPVPQIEVTYSETDPTLESVPQIEITHSTESDVLSQKQIFVEEPVAMEDDPDLPADRMQEEDNEEDNKEEIRYITPEIDASLIVCEPKEEENKIDETTLTPFAKSWIAMCETVLLNVQALYHLFKLNIPQYENFVITIVVNNGIAEAFFADKKREILSYMRNNFAMEIEDIVLDIQTEAVQKKFLLSGREQAELLYQQNSELSDFINLLELKLIE